MHVRLISTHINFDIPFFSLKSRCKKATYCSKSCQTIAWKNGHKRECKIILENTGVELNNMIATKSKGDQRKLENQADNILMAAGEIFMDETGNLLRWSVVNKVDILDCVFSIDFCQAPAALGFHKASDYLRKLNSVLPSGHPLRTNAKRDIARNRAEGAITGFFHTVPAAGGEVAGSQAVFINSFPGDRLLCGSWQAAHNQMKETMILDGWFPISN